MRFNRSATRVPPQAANHDKEVAMAKGQMRSSKEKKKPKADPNKKKGGLPPHLARAQGGQSQPVLNPLGKKTS
jgi:hypothetical protein